MHLRKDMHDWTSLSCVSETAVGLMYIVPGGSILLLAYIAVIMPDMACDLSCCFVLIYRNVRDIVVALMSIYCTIIGLLHLNSAMDFRKAGQMWR